MGEHDKDRNAEAHRDAVLVFTDDPVRDTTEELASLRRMLDHLPVGVFSIDNRTEKVAQANAEYARIMGYASVEDAVGSNVEDHYDDPKERSETFARFHATPGLLAGGAIRFEAVRVRRSTRERIRVRMNVAVQRGVDGHVELLDGVIEEIGGPETVEQAFRSSDTRFRTLFENAGVGMVIATPELVITRVNRAFCELLGYREEEFPGKRVADLVHPDEREQHLSLEKTAEGSRGSREWRFLSKAGALVWGVVTTTWLHDEDGHPLTAVLMVQDVTPQKLVEQELLRVERLESLAQLTGGIAHDFNNALAAILGNVSLAGTMSSGNREMEEVLGHAVEAVHRARGLTQRLMTFSKGGHPRKRPTAIAGLLAKAVELCGGACASTVQLDVEEDLPEADLDVGQMAQAFANLLDNAVQATPAGGRVAVSAREVQLSAATGIPLPAGRYVRIAIRDDGPGIPPQDLPHIFDPFFSTKRMGKGLGLATAHSIVQRHGGHVSATSALGMGSTFSVYLTAAGQRTTPARDVHLSGPPRRGRVLIMDDEPEVRRVTAAMLRASGAEADVVADGAAAVAMFAAAIDDGRPYAAVLLDLTVPGGLGGAEIIGRLRELDPGVHAIVSSGYSASPVLAEWRRFGFSGVLPKPYTLAELREALEGVLIQGDGG